MGWTDDLNLKQEAFAVLYVDGGMQDPAGSAESAGYSPKTARAQASQLLKNPKVRDYVMHLLDLKLERVGSGYDKDGYLKNLLTLNGVTVKTVAQALVEAKGALHDIPDEVAYGIASFKVRVEKDQGMVTGEVIEVKLVDRLGTLHQLARHVDVDATVKANVNVNIAVIDHAAVIAAARDRLRLSEGGTVIELQPVKETG